MSSKFMKTVLGAVLMASAGAAAIYFASNDQASVQDLYGTVEVRQVDLAFSVEGRLDEVLVEEGDRVTEGQKIARLETGYLEDTLSIATARVAAQEQVVAKLRDGPRAQEIAEAEANVASANADLVNATQTFDRQQDLVEKEVSAQSSLDDARAEKDMATARLRVAKEQLALLNAGTRPEEIAEAEARLDAERALKSLAMRRLDDAELTAPSDGVIMTRVREVGSVIAPGTTVLTMAKTHPIWVRAYVPEPQLGSVVPGATVTIYTDSRKDEPYQGRVGYVAPVAEFTPKTVQTVDLRTDLVFRFHVIIKDPDSLIRQGMPVTVRLD
jgi:HlyD family secretion protein